MRREMIIVTAATIFSLLSSARAQNPSAAVAAEADAEVKQKLRDFEDGNLTLEALIEKGGEKFDRQLISFYQRHTNGVSTKALLPISRCFFFFGDFEQASKIAQQYMQVYSNDWHGWHVIGGANLALTNFDKALTAYTNALRLGDTQSCVELGFCAWKLERLDIMTEIVPCMFAAKDNAKSEKDKTDAITILVIYATNADREDVFVKALAGVRPSEVAARDDLTHVVLTVCDRFKTKDLQPFCEKVRALSKNSTEGKQ